MTVNRSRNKRPIFPFSLITFIVFLLTFPLPTIDGARLQFSKMMMGFKTKRVVDFRSDTVTRPNQAMRKAMFEAEVGDDVFQEDPTVHLLEERMAKLFRKEKALYFPTGTMCNLAAVLSWCQKRGSEMILGDKSHIHIYEQGGVSQFGGVATHILPNQHDGTMDITQIQSAIRSNNIHFPVTELIAIENTHNYCGGRVLPLSYVEELGSVSKRNQIPLHLDGARIWNAAVSSQVDVGKLTEPVDSISACLSKGLGAPAGSVLIGPEAFINRARRVRKALGGGMRQSGILAAAGLQALDDFESGLLVQDHKRAKTLGQALSQINGIKVNPDIIETNIILLTIEKEELDSSILLEALKEKGILALPKGPKAVRIVLHRDINDEDIEYASKAIASVFEQLIPAYTSSSATNIEGKSDSVSEAVPTSKIDVDALTGAKEPSKEEVEPHAMTSPALSGASNATTTTTSITLPGIKYPQNPHDITLLNQLNNPYEAAFVCGMSVSDEGFCVFLQGSISDRIIKIAVNPADPLVDGLDREQVESSEAVTLLQLLQGIDVETFLPKDALSTKFNDAKQKYKLRRVMVHSTQPFVASLYGTPRKSNSTTSSSLSSEIVVTPNVTAAIFPERSLLLPAVSSGGGSNDANNGNATYALANSADNSAVNQNNINSNNNNNNNEADGSVPITVPSLDIFLSIDPAKASAMNFQNIQKFIKLIGPNITNPFTVGKEVEIKNPFEAIALSLRHQAFIEIKSEIFQNHQLSYENIEEVKNDYPKLLQPSILTFEEKQNEIRQLISQELTKSNRYLDILIRQLAEAFRQQNESKYSAILSTLEFILQRLSFSSSSSSSGSNQNQGNSASSASTSSASAPVPSSSSSASSSSSSSLNAQASHSLPLVEVVSSAGFASSNSGATGNNTN